MTIRWYVAAAFWLLAIGAAPSHAESTKGTYTIEEMAGLLPGFSSTRRATLLPGGGTIDTKVRNIVVIGVGQSLGANSSGRVRRSKYPKSVHTFNIYDGKAYRTTGPVLGASVSAGGPGNIHVYLADKIIEQRAADVVWLAVTNIGSTKMSDWAVGGTLYERPCILLRRLADRNITPQTPNTTFVVNFQLGESDNVARTPRADWKRSFQQFKTHLTECGFAGRIFVNQETLLAGRTDPETRAAQSEVVDNETVFAGADIDAFLGRDIRSSFDPHLTPWGAKVAADAIFKAMSLSGPPFCTKKCRTSPDN